jgi:hypothetical protein
MFPTCWYGHNCNGVVYIVLVVTSRAVEDCWGMGGARFSGARSLRIWTASTQLRRRIFSFSGWIFSFYTNQFHQTIARDLVQSGPWWIALSRSSAVAPWSQTGPIARNQKASPLQRVWRRLLHSTRCAFDRTHQMTPLGAKASAVHSKSAERAAEI